MTPRLPLLGIRIHLSGSVPENASPEQEQLILSFVQKLAQEVFREGGTLIHGSHPSFQYPLEVAAKQFVQAGGQKDALTLVRSQQYAVTPEQLAEIDAQREYSVVHIIPSIFGKPNKSLIPMREWMGERCDVVIAVGGKWYEINKSAAGVPAELEETLSRGKPGFVVAGLGGAVEGYVRDDVTVLSRLRNGLSETQNRSIAECTVVSDLVSMIVSQIKLLPLVRENISRGMR